MSVQFPSNMYIPNYDYNSSRNSVPSNVSVPIQVAPQQLVEAQEEPSLGSQLTSGVAFMAPIAGYNVWRHPLYTKGALSRTNLLYKDLLKNDAFSKLGRMEQGQAYMNLFKVNQMGFKVQSPELYKELAKSRRLYLDALKAGDKGQAAYQSAKMSKIYELGKTGWFGKAPQSAKIGTEAALKAANEAGAAASKIALETGAKVAEGASKFSTASALAWGKSAWKTGGGTVMACLEGGIETFTEVIPAFSEGGFGEGVAQTAKSAVKVGASVGGWVVGAKAGAAAGAAIGSIFPGAGTAIGAAIGGLIGGIFGSWGGNKIAKAVTGKSWSEKREEMAMNQQPQFQPQVAGNNPFKPSFSGNPFGQTAIKLDPSLPTLQEMSYYLA